MSSVSTFLLLWQDLRTKVTNRTFFAWANDSMRYEDETFRAVVLAGMNTFSNVVNAWWSIVFYGATYAPYFTRGMWAMIGTSIALGVWTTGLLWVSTRAEKKRVRLSEENAPAKVENGAVEEKV